MSLKPVAVAISMKNYLLALLLATIIAIFFSIVAVITTERRPSSQEFPLPQEPSPVSYPVPLYKAAEKITLSELINISKTHNITLYLPTKMPGNIKLVAIYYKPPVVLLSYSDREAPDYRYDNVTIEISIWPSAVPSFGELNLSVKNVTDSRVFSINGARGVLVEHAPWGDPELQKLYGPSPFAFFWIEGHYYIISASPPITGAQLLEIIGSLRPLKG